MTLSPKTGKLLRIASIGLSVAGLLGVFWGMTIWNQYLGNLPRSPNAVTGNIYPRNIHGVVVYQTLKQRSSLDSWDHWSWGIFIFGFVLGLIHEWRWGELRKK